MLFVLGTAEKQFVTDSVFHFQYQYINNLKKNAVSIRPAAGQYFLALFVRQ